MFLPRAALMASLLPALGGCLLYTHEINEAPTVSIEAPTIAPFRGVGTMVSAHGHDDKDPPDRLNIVWVEADGACPSDPDASPPADARSGTGSQYSLVITSFGPVCLYAQATDSTGAAGPWVHRQFVGKNRAPRAQLDISPAPAAGGSIPIYSRVVLSPANSTDEDGDLLEYHWQLTSPDGSTLGDCGATAPEGARCFVPRKEGQYAVQLVAEEKLAPGLPRAMSAAETRMLTVDPDRPPCLEVTNPAIYQDVVLIPSGTHRTFQAFSVSDDGEPYPGPGQNGDTIFVWSTAMPGEKAERTALDGPSIDVSEELFPNLRPGDQVRVRLEVRDKVRESAIGKSQGLPCDDVKKVCNESGKGDRECIRWTTWVVQFYP